MGFYFFNLKTVSDNLDHPVCINVVLIEHTCIAMTDGYNSIFMFYESQTQNVSWILHDSNFSIINSVTISQLECAIDGVPSQIPTLKF